MWISGPTEGLENIFLLLQSTSNPDKRVYDVDAIMIALAILHCVQSVEEETKRKVFGNSFPINISLVHCCGNIYVPA